MPGKPIDELQKVATDALYVSVGLGVIAFQKAQVQRQELRKRVQDRVKTVEERLGGVTEQLKGRFGT